MTVEGAEERCKRHSLREFRGPRRHPVGWALPAADSKDVVEQSRGCSECGRKNTATVAQDQYNTYS